jgi:hypothetical protein
MAVTYLKDAARLQQVPLAPAAALFVDPAWPDLQRQLAATGNRLGGLIQALAAEVQVELPAVLAVWQVESGGRAHSPGAAVIRFENHLFYQVWGQAHPQLYGQYFRHGGFHGQPGNVWEGHQFREQPGAAFQTLHGSQDREYRALALARRLAGDDMALRAISMGGPQILGSNYRMIGYPSPRAMYDAFQADERYHVLGFFDFCRNKLAPHAGDLILALHERRWADFAHYYNGSGQIAVYSARLQDAYHAAALLPAPAATASPPVITPQPPPPPPPRITTASPPAPLSAAQAAQAIAQNERYKISLGWGQQVGKIAGLLGFPNAAPDARAFVQAVAHWQQTKGLEADGIIGPISWRQLRAALGI